MSGLGGNPISRLRWNGGFGACSGPSRGDPFRPAIRPIEASNAGICYGRFTTSTRRLNCANTGHSSRTCRTGQFDPKRAFKIGSMKGWEARESGLRLKASVVPKAAVVPQVLCSRKADIRCFSTQRQSHRLRFPIDYDCANVFGTSSSAVPSAQSAPGYRGRARASSSHPPFRRMSVPIRRRNRKSMVRTSGPRRIGEASEIGGEGFGYRFPVFETPPCGLAPDEDQNMQSSVNEAMIPSRSWAFRAPTNRSRTALRLASPPFFNCRA
jgi:hypothetical protein